MIFKVAVMRHDLVPSVMERCGAQLSRRVTDGCLLQSRRSQRSARYALCGTEHVSILVDTTRRKGKRL
jgi:hypothetical protein